MEEFEVGDLVTVIGKVREYEGEVHLVPEVIREVEDPNWELLRELEILEKREKMLEEGKKPEFEEEEEAEGEPKELELETTSTQEPERVGAVESLGEPLDEEEEGSQVSDEFKDKLLLALDKLEGEDGASLSDLAAEVDEPKEKCEEGLGALLNEDKIYEPIAGKFKRLS